MGRGLFRLWLILTVLWAAFIIFGMSTYPGPGVARMTFGWIAIPSGLVFVVGVMLRWAIGGFSK